MQLLCRSAYHAIHVPLAVFYYYSERYTFCYAEFPIDRQGLPLYNAVGGKSLAETKETERP